jgi:Tol biopolymer transport system component
MTTHDDLELQLSSWFDDVATPRDVELTGVFARTTAMRQRPAWTNPVMWLPRRSAPPRARRAWITRAMPALLTVALLGALLVAALVVGSRPRLPAPVGPARSGLVAYEADGDIYVVQPDGSGRTKLIGGEGTQFGASWSPDGTRIAYWSAPDPREQASLWVAEASGSAAVKVTRDRTFYVEGLPPGTVVWAPDGKRMAFATRTGDLRVVNDDGSNLRRIGEPTMQFSIPTWSPDGIWIAARVMSGDAKTYRGYVVHPDGTGQTPITAPVFSGEDHTGFGWSPDSRAVIYHTTSSDDADIAISRMDAAGAWREEVLVDGANYNVLPAWSNDGQQLAFIRVEGLGTAGQVSHVMVAKRDGSEPHVVSDRVVDRYAPCWSPDDRSIRVVSYSAVDLRPVLDVIALDGSGIVETPGWAAGCAWQRLAP